MNFGTPPKTHRSRWRALGSVASLPSQAVPRGYFAGAALLFASARRSSFRRRAARFFTLSLPLQCPIGRHQTRSRRCYQAVSQPADGKKRRCVTSRSRPPAALQRIRPEAKTLRARCPRPTPPFSPRPHSPRSQRISNSSSRAVRRLVSPKAGMRSLRLP